MLPVPMVEARAVASAWTEVRAPERRFPVGRENRESTVARSQTRA